jgi:hypothetical protein
LKKASRTPELLIFPDRVDIDLTVLRRLEKAGSDPFRCAGTGATARRPLTISSGL